MVESPTQTQIPHQEQNPQQSSSPTESLGSPIPLYPAKQVDFNINEITLKTKNEVALLYLDHPNKDTFFIVSDFISKCCLREAFTKSPIQYKEYLVEFWYTVKVLKDSSIVWFSTPIGGVSGEVGLNSFRKAIEQITWVTQIIMLRLPPLKLLGTGSQPLRIVGQLKPQEPSKRAFFLQGGGCLWLRVNIDFAKSIWDDIVSKLKKKTREKVIPYLRFLSLLLELKIEGYGSDEVTIYPTF
ncbi:hypothetical protein Tco_0727428 [Tanacetum coccineum]|uniref:Uncharacterized protein n=1 Tax=Tanacetum coccineum TaxID=301880 RepID=A0ABQ4YKW6_9ASTR